MPANCPDDITLLSFAIGGADGTPRGLATHVEQCRVCQSVVERHREMAAGVRLATREADDVHGECLDEMAIAALAEGVADDAARDVATRHLVTCDSCRSQLAELRAALNDVSIVAAMPPASPAPRRRRRFAFVGSAGLAAAAVLVLAIARNATQTKDDAPLRDETEALVAPPLTIAPVDVVSGTLVFRWTSVPGTNLYRVVVYDLDGVVAWETQTSDTTATPASPIPLKRGTRYLWKVFAQTDYGRWGSGSTLTEFEISDGGAKR